MAWSRRRRENAGVGVRLGEVLVALSGVGDLARERRPGSAARSCLLACRIARRLDLDEPTIRDIFYTALLQHVGCVGYAQEAAAVFQGRDIEMNLAGSHTDFADPRDLFRTFVPELSAGTNAVTTMRILVAALTKAPRFGPVVNRASCEVAAMTARRIGLRAEVADILAHVEEWYSGKGGYLGTKGDAIPIGARVVLTAMTAAVFHDLGGPEVAVRVVAKRAGNQLDPQVADAFANGGTQLLAELDAVEVDQAVLAEEPWPHLRVDGAELDEVALAFGQIVDLKSSHTHGAAQRAYDLAGVAATNLGLERQEVGRIQRAAALRDIGKAAISNAILDKTGALNADELDEIRLHPYRTERLLARAPVLAAESALAALHHEHEDGSGYHRGVTAGSIPIGGKLLAVVDAYIEATQDRRGLPSHPEQACTRLAGLARRGQLEPSVVRCVVAAVEGRAMSSRRVQPAGLSDRQVEVLRLLAKGLSNKEIARELFVSPRTAEHHVQDIYAKVGASSRAAAALFAMQHQLL